MERYSPPNHALKRDAVELLVMTDGAEKPGRPSRGGHTEKDKQPVAVEKPLASIN